MINTFKAIGSNLRDLLNAFALVLMGLVLQILAVWCVDMHARFKRLLLI